MIAEICCGSLKDVIISEKVGADRVELNSSLSLGGLTPSMGLLVSCLERTSIPIVTMVRPRGGGFSYNRYELDNMMEDINLLVKYPIKGIAFGILKDDKTFNIEYMKKIIDKLKTYEKEVIVHRAFDNVLNPREEIEKLIKLEVDRILTGGLNSKALEGVDILKDLQDEYKDEIEILAGGGVNYQNVEEIYKNSGITQFHSSCRVWREDITSQGNISYNYSGIKGCDYEEVDEVLARKFVEDIKKL